jgi:hypothetical protein
MELCVTSVNQSLRNPECSEKSAVFIPQKQSYTCSIVGIKTETFRTYMSQCYFLHEKSHTDYLVIEFGPPW